MTGQSLLQCTVVAATLKYWQHELCDDDWMGQLVVSIMFWSPTCNSEVVYGKFESVTVRVSRTT